MKRIITSVLMAGCAGMMFAVGFGAPAQAWSPQIKGGETVTIKKDETHKGSLYVTGDSVKIDGTVEGDVYCGARTVEITGTIEGGVSCAAQELKVSGTVEQGVRLAGQDVAIEGVVNGDVSVAGQIVQVAEAARVGGDVNGYAQAVTIDGVVQGGLRLGAEKMTLNGTVGAASDIVTQSLTFGENGQFKSNLDYSASQELSINDGNVAGDVTYNTQEATATSSDMLMTLALIAGTFIFTGMVIAAALPQLVERSSRRAKGAFGQTLLAGSAVVFVTPIVATLFLISYFGMFLGIVLLFVWAVTLMLSGVFFAYYLGAIILQNSQNILVRMLCGLVLLAALWLIPIVQIIAIFATIIVGTGLLVRTLFDGQFDNFRYTLAPLPPKPAMPVALGGEPKKADLETPRPIAKKTTIKKATTKKPGTKKKTPPKEKK